MYNVHYMFQNYFLHFAQDFHLLECICLEGENSSVVISHPPTAFSFSGTSSYPKSEIY